MGQIDITVSEDLESARQSLELYQKYSSLAGKTSNSKLFTLSYIFGLNAVQQLMRIYKNLKNEKSKKECNTKAGEIITLLEDAKNKQLKRIEKGSRYQSIRKIKSRANDKAFMEVLEDDNKARLFLNRWCTDQLDKVEAIIKGGFVDLSTVDMLLNICTALQASIDMYPVELDNKEHSEHEKEELEEIEKDSELYEQKLSQAEDALNNNKGLQHTSGVSTRKAEDLTRDQLEEKIKWCKFCISRICSNTKAGKDPNDDLTLMIGANGKEQLEISEEEVNQVIESVLNMRDDGNNNSENSDDDSDNYYYDSDEEEYVKKGELSSKFPKPPVETKDKKEYDIGEKSKLDTNIQPKNEIQREPQASIEITPASIVASKSAKENSLKKESPPDLQSLEKELDNSGLLESAKKCCKFAVSAIQYEDVDTALDELQEAMNLLKSYQAKMGCDKTERDGN